MDTVAALLRASPLAPLEARILLAHVLGWRRTELITRSDEHAPILGKPTIFAANNLG